MNHERVLYRRTFDWFSLIYPVVPIGIMYWVIAHFGETPLRQPVFWIIVAAISASQGIYFVAASRSPTQLELQGEDLIVRWHRCKREIRVPRHHVRCDKSSWFNTGCILWCAGQKVLIFPNRRMTIQDLEEAIQGDNANANLKRMGV